MRQVSSKRKHSHAVTCGYAFLILADAKPCPWVQSQWPGSSPGLYAHRLALIERSEGRCARSASRQLVDFSTTQGLVLSKSHDMA
jgi:hypothetical protein